MSPHVIRHLAPSSLLFAAAVAATIALWKALRLAAEGYEDDGGFHAGRPAGYAKRQLRLVRKSWRR